ncbi:hypothetical protein ABPG75_011393 [Micractinium tetrahymenae]
MNALSDDLLTCIFASIDLRERQRTLSRVCQRWAEVALSPVLLQELRTTVDESHVKKQGAKFRAFWAWFAARAAAHAHQLVFTYDPPWEAGAPELPAALQAAMQAGLAAPGLTQLTQLQLRMGGSFTVLSPLAALPALRTLHCLGLSLHDCEDDRDVLTLQAPLTRLTALEELALRGNALSALTALRMLRLSHLGMEAGARLALLPCLGRLEHLTLGCCWALPGWMSRLTALTSLDLDGSPEDNFEVSADVAMGAALPALQCVRELCISNVPNLASVPPALSALSCLESLVLSYHLPGEFDSPPRRLDAAAQLPAGAWLSRLEAFSTTGQILHASLAVLTASSVPRLAEVGVNHLRFAAELADILAWAGAQPRLERLHRRPIRRPRFEPGRLPPMEPPAAPHDDGLAAITRQNLRALLVTRSQLQALAPLIAALAGHVGHELAEALLEGCFVRLRSPEGYILRRILSAQLPPLGPEAGTADVADDPSAGAWPLTVEVEVLQPGKPSVRVLAMRVSDADPFHDPAAYDAGGREELRRHRAERAAAGCPPGLPLGPTAAAAWRRHVALIWANGSLLGTLGVSQLVAGLQDDAKLEEQLQFIQKLEPQAPAPGPLYAPPAATPAADAQPEASEDAAAAVATPAYVLPAAAAGERLPVDAAGPAAAPQQAAALPGPAFESGLHLPAVGSGLPLQEQQQPQASMQQPVQPVQPAYADPARQPQQWQGPGQQAMHPWHHPPAGMQPQSVRVQPGQVLGPSPFETAAAAAPRVGLAWPASGPPPPQQQQQAWQGQLPPRCSLPAGPSLGGSALGGAASGTAPPWAGGVLDPRGSAAGGPGVQPGSPRFFGLTVTALPAGTTDGQLAAFIRPKYPHSFASARVTEARRGVIKFTSLEERDAAYSEVNGMLFAGNVLGTEMPAGEPPPPVACLWVSSLPSDCRNAAVLNLFRQRFPSVMSVRHLGAPRQSAGSRDASCFVRFPSEEERDAALVEMHGALFEGYPIRTDMPKGDKLRWSHRPLASLLPQRGAAEGPPAGAPAAPLQLRRSQQAEAAPKPARHKKQAEAEGLFPLLVLNVGDAMSQEELLEYFRERYPSAASVVMQHGFGTVRFSSDQERQRAHVEMEGHVLPAPAQWVPPGLAWQHQPPDEAWARSPMDARWMCPPPGAPDLPPWLPRLFMDACHRLDWRRGLPLADREVLQEMDELAGEPVCLRSLGISMYRLCLLMEERGLVRLRPTPGAAIVTELCM